MGCAGNLAGLGSSDAGYNSFRIILHLVYMPSAMSSGEKAAFCIVSIKQDKSSMSIELLLLI